MPSSRRRGYIVSISFVQTQQKTCPWELVFVEIPDTKPTTTEHIRPEVKRLIVDPTGLLFTVENVRYNIRHVDGFMSNKRSLRNAMVWSMNEKPAIWIRDYFYGMHLKDPKVEKDVPLYATDEASFVFLKESAGFKHVVLLDETWLDEEEEEGDGTMESTCVCPKSVAIRMLNRFKGWSDVEQRSSDEEEDEENRLAENACDMEKMMAGLMTGLAQKFEDSVEVDGDADVFSVQLEFLD